MVWTFFSTRNLRIQLRIACRLTCKSGEEEQIINCNDLTSFSLFYTHNYQLVKKRESADIMECNTDYRHTMAKSLILGGQNSNPNPKQIFGA